MSERKHIYALTFEYSYANNNDGNQSPDEAGGIIALFEDEDDANVRLEQEKNSGEWGGFDDDGDDENDGWSTGGYTLGVEAQEIVPSSKGKA